MYTTMPTPLRENIFTCNGGRMVFCIRDCSDAEDLEDFIQRAGGLALRSADFSYDGDEGPYTITIVNPGSNFDESAARDAFSSDFILKCCLKDSILPLKNFWVKKSGLFPSSFDPQDVLFQRISWLEAEKLNSPLRYDDGCILSLNWDGLEEEGHSSSKRSKHAYNMSRQPVVLLERLQLPKTLMNASDSRLIIKQKAESDIPSNTPVRPKRNVRSTILSCIEFNGDCITTPKRARNSGSHDVLDISVRDGKDSEELMDCSVKVGNPACASRTWPTNFCAETVEFVSDSEPSQPSQHEFCDSNLGPVVNSDIQCDLSLPVKGVGCQTIPVKVISIHNENSIPLRGIPGDLHPAIVDMSKNNVLSVGSMMSDTQSEETSHAEVSTSSQLSTSSPIDIEEIDVSRTSQTSSLDGVFSSTKDLKHVKHVSKTPYLCTRTSRLSQKRTRSHATYSPVQK